MAGCLRESLQHVNMLKAQAVITLLKVAIECQSMKFSQREVLDELYVVKINHSAPTLPDPTVGR